MGCFMSKLFSKDVAPCCKYCAVGRLTADGTCTVYKKNAEGEYDSEEDGESYDAAFSGMEDGRLLFETANGIELEYDIMGHQD